MTSLSSCFTEDCPDIGPLNKAFAELSFRPLSHGFRFIGYTKTDPLDNDGDLVIYHDQDFKSIFQSEYLMDCDIVKYLDHDYVYNAEPKTWHKVA